MTHDDMGNENEVSLVTKKSNTICRK
jgi:hypothetical protein